MNKVPQKMTLKEARNAGVIGHQHRQVIVPKMRRAIRFAGPPNAKGIMRVETVPDYADNRQSVEQKLGASEFCLVFDTTPDVVEPAVEDICQNIGLADG